jgi:hypothetical protein
MVCRRSFMKMMAAGAAFMGTTMAVLRASRPAAARVRDLVMSVTLL